VGKRTGERA
jgi:hypothetical protein